MRNKKQWLARWICIVLMSPVVLAGMLWYVFRVYFEGGGELAEIVFERIDELLEGKS